MNEIENRALLVKGMVAGGLTIIGLATGSHPLLALMISTSVNVGGSLIADVVDRAIDQWRDQWFSPKGAFGDPIRAALRLAFEEAMKQLELDWKRSSDYHTLIFKKEHERAQFSLTLLHELSKDANRLFQESGELEKAMAAEGHLLISREVDEDKASRQAITIVVERYLGAVEPLAEFAQKNLANQWIFRFGEVLKSDKGTPAWRACQELWLSSLYAGLMVIQQQGMLAQEEIVQVKSGLQEIKGWLEDWQSRLASLPADKRDSTGEDSFNTNLVPVLSAINDNLVELQAGQSRVVELLRSNFSHLDTGQVMANFLQKELINDQYVYLKQAGHGQDIESVSLAKVFVDLPVSDSYQIEPPKEYTSEGKQKPGFVYQVLQVSNLHLDPLSIQLGVNQADEDILPADKKENPGRFVLVGGPGQGKTTISQFICQLFRSAILKERREATYMKVRTALGEIEAICKQEMLDLPSVPRFPFRIVLNDFAARLADPAGQINSLLEYIKDRIQYRTGEKITVPTLRCWLADYPWIIIFDGLDEVPASSNRDQVLSAIDDFWIDATGSNADILVVATTRPQGYHKDFAPNIYIHDYLLPFSKARAAYFARRLVETLYPLADDHRLNILNRLESALEEEATSRLMTTPLQVTIMIALVQDVGKPPQERWSLFDKYYNVIYNRETQRNLVASTVLRSFRPDINAIHHRVGLLLQVESEYSGLTGSSISFDTFAALVENRLAEEGHKGSDLESLKRQIIEAAIDRLVFLVGLREKEIGFEIRSFQEFMAAEALMDGSDEQVRKRLREIASVVNWRNVFLFAAGKCFATRQHLRETILNLCTELNEVDPASKDELDHAVFGGSQLALDLLEDGPARNQPKWSQGLMRLALRLIDLPADELHIRLAELYNPQFDEVYREELERRLGSIQLAGNQGVWFTLFHLVEKTTWAESLAEQYWPHDESVSIELLKLGAEARNLPAVYLKNLAQISQLSFRDIFMNFQNSSWISRVADFSPVSYTLLTLVNEELHRREESVELPFPKEGEKILHLYFNPINDPELVKAYSMLKGISNPTPRLLSLVSGARFSKNPSSRTLARELKLLARCEDVKVEELVRNGWVELIPWPLASILNRIVNREELFEASALAEAGEFGDREDWLAAEVRWKQQGITIDDLEYMNGMHWPYDRNIAHLGYPLSLHRMSFHHFRQVKERGLFRELIAFYIRSQHSKFRAEIVRWLLFCFGVADASLDSIVEPLNSKQFLEIIENLEQDYFLTTRILMILMHFANGSEEFVLQADRLGRERNFYYQEHILEQKLSVDQQRGVIQFLAAAWKTNPECLGLLRLLATFSLHREIPSLPVELLDHQRYPDPKFRAAAITVHIAQRGWSNEEASKLLQAVAETSTQQPDLINKVVNLLSRWKLLNSSEVAFLLSMMKQLPPSAWQEKQMLTKLLFQAYSSRTSRVRQSWEVLELPLKILVLIHTEVETAG